MRSLSLAVSFVFLAAVALLPGCGGGTGSDADELSETVAYLGSAEDCAKEGKVLVCHVPPGNPANAHTICIGAPAVRAHQRNHGDELGACGGTEGEPTDPGTNPDDPSDPDDFDDGLPNTTDPDGTDGEPTDPGTTDPTDPSDPGTVPPGTAEPGDPADPGATDPGEPTCRAEYQACDAAAACCEGLICDAGKCVPNIY